MSSQLITELDSNFSNSEVQLEYPHLFIETKHTDALPLIIDLMESGDTPIYYQMEGIVYEIGRVSPDPLNLNRLLRVYPFKFITDAQTSHNITNSVELMEVC